MTPPRRGPGGAWRKLWRRRAALAALLLLPALAWAQPDYAREQRWADEITPSILVGDPVYLTLPSKRRFLAVHAPAANAIAAVVVVHGIGVHPDWGLINILRSELPDLGYTTLSVQMPVLAADARPEAYGPLLPEAGERLKAAIAYLRQAGHRKVAIASHSLGSRMTDEFLAGSAPGAVEAWVAIGLTGTFRKPSALRLPVLDLYGERDLPGVLRASHTREAALRAVTGARQEQIAGADHFFNGRTTQLVAAVRAFLDAQFKR